MELMKPALKLSLLWLVLCLFLLIFPVFSRIARADDLSRFELAISWELSGHSFGSSYLHHYSPPFEPGEALSSASHHLELSSAKARGSFISLGLFPLKIFGVEISYFHLSASIHGQSSDYEVLIEYISRPPPFYEPVKIALDFSHAWPSPHGQLDLKIININPCFRLVNKRTWGLAISFGLSSFFLKGELGPLAFTRFWLGGHSVLFSEEYKILARLLPNHDIGFNTGATFSQNLYDGLNLFLDIHYYSSPKIPLRLEALDYDRNYEQPGIEPLARISPYLAFDRVIFNPSLFSLNFGLKFKF